MQQRRRQGLNKREQRALARILLTVLLIALLLLAFAPGRSLHSLRQMNKKAEVVAEENKTLLQKTVQLNEEIKLLQHNEQHLEKIAREQYRMLKKNEEVYYYDSVEPAESPAPPDSNLAAP